MTGVQTCALPIWTITALAQLIGRREMALEARLFTAANIALLLLPFIAALGYVAIMTGLHESSLIDEFRRLLQRVSLLVALVVLLPVSLTLALVWAAKDTLVQELAHRDDPASRGQAAS